MMCIKRVSVPREKFIPIFNSIHLILLYFKWNIFRVFTHINLANVSE